MAGSVLKKTRLSVWVKLRRTQFALELGHCPTQSACLKRANAGSDASSFDHLVGAAEIGRRQSRCCMRACISCKALGVALVSPAAARY